MLSDLTMQNAADMQSTPPFSRQKMPSNVPWWTLDRLCYSSSTCMWADPIDVQPGLVAPIAVPRAFLEVGLRIAHCRTANHRRDSYTHRSFFFERSSTLCELRTAEIRVGADRTS